VTPWRVRPLPEFFHALDRQLSDERGPNGEPSRYDFLSLELPESMEDFALLWDSLPRAVQHRDDYRILVKRGHLVAAMSIEAQLSPVSGVIELVDIHLELTWPDDRSEDDQS
jgi:hypothetical protein